MRKINIVIPMAGAGSRFAKEGYELPKPFVDVDGKMMIERVLDGLTYPDARYILIIKQDFLTEHAERLEKLKENYDIDFVTDFYVEGRGPQGASHTCMAVHKLINDDIPVAFADSDNIFQSGLIGKMVADSDARKLDASLITFQTQEDCFSFIELDENGHGIRTAEKDPISTNAIAGVYYFNKGKDFIHAAIDMIFTEDRVKGEFYMSNIYNHLINNDKKVGMFNIEDHEWTCVGTPKQLNEYLAGDRRLNK